MRDLKSTTLNAATWNFSKLLVGQLRTFIVSTILARLLMPEDFGLLGMAMVFASLTDSFVDFGFGNAVIQKQRVNRVQLSTVFWINMLMALVLGVLMYISAPLIASYFEMPKLEAITRLMSLTFLIKGLTTLQNALFRKNLDYKTPFKVEVSAGILSGALGIYLAYTGFGVYSLIYSQILGWTIGTILIWYFSVWKPSFLFDIKQIKELWSFGYKYSLSIFIDSIFSRMDTLVIGKVFSASVLGLFYKAQSLNKLVVQYAFSSFSGVLFPSLSKMAQDEERLRAAMIRILNLVCFTTFLFSGLMFINAESIIVLLLTEKWIGSVPIFKILAVFSFIFTIPTILSNPVLSIGKSGAILKVEVFKKLLYLLAIPVAIYYGLFAYISSTIIAAMVGITFNLFLVKKFFNFRYFDFYKTFLIYFVPFLIIIGIDIFTPSFIDNLILRIIFKSIVFILIFFTTNVILKTSGFIEFLDILKPLVIKIQNIRKNVMQTITTKVLRRLKLHLKSFGNYFYRKYAKQNLRNSEFTLISNNCYAGHLYETINRPYNTPTVGLYFFAEDYIKFIEDIDKYLNEELNFINSSRFQESYQEHKKKKYPIGLLSNNLEIHFLHYKNEEEAKEKWNRRKKRVLSDKILVVMNDQNRFHDDLMERFDNVNFPKIFFSARPRKGENVKVIKYYYGKDHVGDMYNDKLKIFQEFNFISWVKSFSR